MKKPYLTSDERLLIEMDIASGAYAKLKLSFLKLIRNIKKAILWNLKGF